MTAAQKREESLKYRGVTYSGHTFESMRHPKGFEPVYRAFRELATGAPWHMLMVYGGTGNGKTRCCEALVIALYDRGIFCRRDRWSDIVRHLKSLMGKPGRDENSYEDYFNRLRTRNILILDDVGSGSTGGSWEWGELEDIIDYRLEHKLLTVVTTNLDIKSIPERIFSRFKDKGSARLVFNESPDQRPLEGKTGAG